jgi:hypothetical protein
LIQKYANGLFKDNSLALYGIKTAKIKEIVNVELPVVEVSDSLMDFVFLLEDDTYLHIEFQSSYNKNDLLRFAKYDIRLYERDGRQVITVIIYTADVKHVNDMVNIGSLIYQPQRVMMGDYDGNAVYAELIKKFESNNDITDEDMLKLIFLPLMKHSIDIGELAAQSVKIAKLIPDTMKRNACVAAAYVLGSKFLNEEGLKKLKEAIKMIDIISELITEGEEKRAAVIAKKMLARGISIDAVAEDTGLEESVVKVLQTELREAV